MGRRLASHRGAASSVTALLLVSTAMLMPQSLKQWSAAPSARIAAERSILRLPPAAFPELPAPVQQALERDGCRIPQREEGEALRTIVSGEFARAGQTDWAVICSRQNRSSIRVFWGGAPACPAMIGTAEDSRFLKPLPSGELEFARELEVDRSATRERAGGGPHVLLDRLGSDLRAEYRCTDGRWVEAER
jgi:hypothetical protein